MKQIAIEKCDINKFGRPQYPWMKCAEVGDGFFVTNRTIQHMSACANWINKRSKLNPDKWFFSCRTIVKGGKKGVMVARTR